MADSNVAPSAPSAAPTSANLTGHHAGPHAGTARISCGRLVANIAGLLVTSCIAIYLNTVTISKLSSPLTLSLAQQIAVIFYGSLHLWARKRCSNPNAVTYAPVATKASHSETSAPETLDLTTDGGSSASGASTGSSIFGDEPSGAEREKEREHPLNWRQLITMLAPLAIALGSISGTYNLSLRLIPPSFVNTIKSSIPIFTLLVCRFLYQQRFPTSTYLTVLPIVAGLALASMSEVTFNLAGFFLACLSSLASTMFALLTKKLMGNPSLTLDNVQIQFYVSCICLGFMLPVWLLTAVDWHEVAAMTSFYADSHSNTITMVSSTIAPLSTAAAIAGSLKASSARSAVHMRTTERPPLSDINDSVATQLKPRTHSFVSSAADNEIVNLGEGFGKRALLSVEDSATGSDESSVSSTVRPTSAVRIVLPSSQPLLDQDSMPVTAQPSEGKPSSTSQQQDEDTSSSQQSVATAQPTTGVPKDVNIDSADASETTAAPSKRAVRKPLTSMAESTAAPTTGKPALSSDSNDEDSIVSTSKPTRAAIVSSAAPTAAAEASSDSSETSSGTSSETPSPVAKTTKQPTTVTQQPTKPAVEESAESASAAPTKSAMTAVLTSSSVSTTAPVEPTQSKAADPIIFNTPAPQSAVDIPAVDAATSKQSVDDSVGLSEIVASPTRAARTLAPRGVAGRPTQPVNVWEALFFLFLAATNFYVETFSVYACIGSFAPVPYAIVDVVRRLTMIMFSVFVFRNPITMVNALGVCVSLAGVLLYNVVTTRASQAEAVSTGNVQLAVSK